MPITNREQWLEARKNGIGASEAAAVAGQSRWKSNIELWEEKTGRRIPDDISDKPAVKYGNDAEPMLRALFALDFPQYTVTYDQFGMIRNNPDCPFAFATLDGKLTEKIRINDGTDVITRRGILEIKTTEIQRSSQWSEWDNRVPDNYFLQVAHQFLATGYEFAYLKAQIRWRKGYVSDGELCVTTRHYYMERTDENIQAAMKMLATQEKRFWRYVETDTMPPKILPEI
jgi:putative phage-type endonuclease